MALHRYPRAFMVVLVALVVLTSALSGAPFIGGAQEQEGQSSIKLIVDPIQEISLPIGTVTYEVLDLGDGVAILAYNTVASKPTVILIKEGALVWSMELEGLEPLSMEYRAGYLHAYTRDRNGALEIVRYYRLSLEGEVLDERDYPIGRGYLTVSATLTTIGLVIAGTVYSMETGWDPFVATVDTIAGLVGIHAIGLQGDQEAISMAFNVDTVCVTYYTPQGGPAGQECTALPGLSPEKGGSWSVDAPPATSAAAAGNCLVLAGEEGPLLVSSRGVEGPSGKGKPLAALEVSVEGLGRALAVGGSIDGKPWMMVGLTGIHCVEGYIEGPVSTGPGAIVSLDPAGDGGILASILQPDGEAALVKYRVSYVVTDTQQGEANREVREASQPGGIQGIIASQALTVALLASLLVLLATAILFKRGVPGRS